MDKTQLEAFQDTIDRFIAVIQRLDTTKPSDYFIPIFSPQKEIGPEDPFPPEFYIAANFVNPARQVEIFNFTYLGEIKKLLYSVKKSMNRYELLASTFYLRCFLETLSYYLWKVDEVVLICEELMGADVNDTQTFTEEKQLRIFKAIKKLTRIRQPTSINYQALFENKDFTADLKVKKENNKTNHLKLLNKKIPNLEQLYDVLCEILHPNAVPSITVGMQGGLIDKQGNLSTRFIKFDYDEEKQSRLYFEVMFGKQISPRALDFLNTSEKLLTKKHKQLAETHLKCLKYCKSFARYYLKTYTDLNDPRYHDGLICPCGSKKEFKKCCGKLIQYH